MNNFKFIFKEEDAVGDGVTREAYTCFFEEFYKFCDGIMARDGNDEKSVSNFCFFSDLFLSNIELNALQQFLELVNQC